MVKAFRTLGALFIAVATLVALPGTAQAAAGLNGYYYSTGGVNPGSNANAIAWTTSHSPTVTFLATAICYPNCSGGNSNDGDGLASWLNTGATNISGTVANLAQHVLDLTGYVYIASAGSQTFQIGSDDGSGLYIDGNLLVNNDGEHGVAYASNSINLSQGWHAIRIIQWENGGGTALSATLNGSALTSSVLSTTAAVPEPATWAMMIGGFGLVGFALRSRRRNATAAA